MSQGFTCPVCNHENSPQIRECVNCGAPLIPDVTTTLPVPGQIAENIRHELVLRRTKLAPGSIALYVMGEKLPLVIDSKGQTTILGRLGIGEQLAIVDLSKYQAHMLGVSRQHAAITFSDGNYTIEDLNSSNGTWINENRLPPNQPRPLRNGDVVRLGQLIIFVYLH
jgi:hypothetical protein